MRKENLTFNQSSLADKPYWDELWETRGEEMLDFKIYINYRIGILLDTYLPKKNLLALEVGAGNSVWLPYLAKKYDYKVVGLDYSKVGCELLKTNLKSVNNPSLVVYGDIFQDCFCHGTFDVIFSNGFIEHFTNYQEILRIFNSWLKPGGMLVTIVPNKNYCFRYVEKWLAPDTFDSHVLIDPLDLERAYKQVNLTDIVSSYFGSFSTWKYGSHARGLMKVPLSLLARCLCLPVQSILRISGLEPESKSFSPMIFAVGIVPST